MLLNFKVSNYRSIQEVLEINMKASGLSELEDNTFNVNGNRLLKTVSIIGPNAAGKSNILNALVLMRHLVINSSKEYQAKEKLPIEPFRLSNDTEKEPSFFQIEFIVKKETYIYGFRADKTKIHNEWLFRKLKTTSKVIFTRDKKKFDYGKEWSANESIERFNRPNALYLSVAAQWNIKLAEEIIEWFLNVNALHGLSFTKYAGVSIDLLQSKKMRKKLVELMRKADLGIEGMKVKKSEAKLDKDYSKYLNKKYKKELAEIIKKSESFEVLTYHPKYDAQRKLLKLVEFNMNREESDGTRKFFSLIGAILEAIINGELVIIDELDARLHPELVSAIINFFNSTTNKTGQLICVNFSTSIMDSSLLRRDQIYLVEKNNFGSTVLSNVSEFKVRKTQPIEKHYREGRLGGKPIIEDFENLMS